MQLTSVVTFIATYSDSSGSNHNVNFKTEHRDHQSNTRKTLCGVGSIEH